MTFEERIKNNIYPSAEEIENLHAQNLTREEICNRLHISPSTYKKLRRYHKIPVKKRVVNKNDYKIRVARTKDTIVQKYGKKGTPSYELFCKNNHEKAKMTCLRKYGNANLSGLDFVKQKRKQTCLEKYGVENPMQCAEFQQKAQRTDFQKYGTIFHIASPVVKSKIDETIDERYGGHSNMSQLSTAKRVSTNIERYGFSYPLQDPARREEANIRMYLLGKRAVFTSRQQYYLCQLFKGIINYPIGPYHVDCYIPEDNIIIEYSGGGHDLSVKLGRMTRKQFTGKEKARLSYFCNRNIPVLEFVSKTDKLPTDDILLKNLSEAKKQFDLGVKYVSVNLDSLK